MEESFKNRQLKVDIQDIKLIKPTKAWIKPKSNLKLSLGKILVINKKNNYKLISRKEWKKLGYPIGISFSYFNKIEQ